MRSAVATPANVQCVVAGAAEEETDTESFQVPAAADADKALGLGLTAGGSAFVLRAVLKRVGVAVVRACANGAGVVFAVLRTGSGDGFVASSVSEGLGGALGLVVFILGQSGQPNMTAVADTKYLRFSHSGYFTSPSTPFSMKTHSRHPSRTQNR